jgi:hypothetical protein
MVRTSWLTRGSDSVARPFHGHLQGGDFNESTKTVNVYLEQHEGQVLTRHLLRFLIVSVRDTEGLNTSRGERMVLYHTLQFGALRQDDLE